MLKTKITLSVAIISISGSEGGPFGWHNTKPCTDVESNPGRLAINCMFELLAMECNRSLNRLNI